MAEQEISKLILFNNKRRKRQNFSSFSISILPYKLVLLPKKTIMFSFIIHNFNFLCKKYWNFVKMCYNINASKILWTVSSVGRATDS